MPAMQKRWPAQGAVLCLAILGMLTFLIVFAAHRSRLEPEYSVTFKLPPPRPYAGGEVPAPGFSEAIAQTPRPDNSF